MRDGADKKTDRKEYLIYALSQIDDNTVWSETEQELSGHIDDREEYFKDCGYDDEQAAQMAVERMGSPEAAADGFSKVYKSYRRITAIIATVFFPFILLWVWYSRFYNFMFDDFVNSGSGFGEAMLLLYIIGLSFLGKRRNSRFICFAAAIDFILMYGVHLLFMITNDSLSLVYSPIVLKFICLLTGDFECFGILGFTVISSIAPYITYLSIAFYAIVFIMLVLVFVSVCMLKKPTYTLKKKHFAKKMFKFQKAIWTFIALTVLISPIWANFDKDKDANVETGFYNAIMIAQSDSPCQISEIPKEDILNLQPYYSFDSRIFVDFGDFDDYDTFDFATGKNIAYSCGYDIITKPYGNKLEREIAENTVTCYATKKYIYVKFYYDGKSNGKARYENWFEAESMEDIITGYNENNRLRITISKAE